MTNPMIRIHNIETDEIINREMTDDEFVLYQQDESRESAKQAQAQAQATAKAALLKRLGITADEAALLLA
jgi:hypothetical protein